jgi:DNA replication protein DnaC
MKMPSLEVQLAQELVAKGAHPRDIAYATANIPQEFWDIKRSDINKHIGNNRAYLDVCDYVDHLSERISQGRGVTLIGAAKTGKTMFGCAILKSAAIDPGTLMRRYRVWRGNYDTILDDLLFLKGESEYAELKNILASYDILFIDSVSLTPPTSTLLSILRTRRDHRKSTFLATSVPPDQVQTSRIIEMFSIFSDVNKQWLLKTEAQAAKEEKEKAE